MVRALTIPRLLTPRLRLRGPTPEDFEAYAAMWADPDVVRHITGKPLSAEESWARLLRQIGHWSLGFGFWAIEDREDGSLIGQAGLALFRRELSPPASGLPECGWVLAARAQGRGLATEAMRAALSWADETIAGPTVCMIAQHNHASGHVATKLGFRFSHNSVYRDDPVRILLRPVGG